MNQLKSGNTVAEELDDVAIMFADIVGFTNFSSGRSPAKVIQALASLFSNFDKLCVENLCYKVCTIGDCYVAIAFTGYDLKRAKGVELLNLLSFGFQLIQAIEQTNKQMLTTLQMRIGIHVGKIIGGITGSNIVRYDIYGADVMVANKMESSGKSGCINVSAKTKYLIELVSKSDQFRFVFNQRVPIQLRKKEGDNDISTDCFFVYKNEINDFKNKE